MSERETVIVEKKGKDDGGLVAATAIQGISDVTKETITQLGQILQQLIQASMSNPLIGGAVVLWTNGLIASFKKSDGTQVIDSLITNAVTGIVLASFGISAIGEIAEIITGHSSASDLVRPSVNTMVTGQGADTTQLTALLPLLTKLLA